MSVLCGTAGDTQLKLLRGAAQTHPSVRTRRHQLSVYYAILLFEARTSWREIEIFWTLSP